MSSPPVSDKLQPIRRPVSGKPRLKPGRRWLEQVRICSSKTSRRYTTRCAPAWKLRRSFMGRSTEQVGRTFVLSGEGVQQAEQAAERSARNAQTLLYSGTAAARVMSGNISGSTSRWFGIKSKRTWTT